MSAEEVHNVLEVFRATLVPNTEVIRKAEVQLGEFQKLPGFMTILSNIATMREEVPDQLRLAAVLRMLNLARSHWLHGYHRLARQDLTTSITDEDRKVSAHLVSISCRYIPVYTSIVEICEFVYPHAHPLLSPSLLFPLSFPSSLFHSSSFTLQHIHENLIQLIVDEPTWKIRLQLLEILRRVINCDFPTHWPKCLETCIGAMDNASDASQMFGAISSYEMLIRVMAPALSPEGVKNTNTIVSAGFDLIGNAVDTVLNEGVTADNVNILKACFKAFANSVRLFIPEYLRPHKVLKKSVKSKEEVYEFDFSACDAWMGRMLNFLSIPAPESVLEEVRKTGEEEAGTLFFFKAKKWALKALDRLIGRPLNGRASVKERKVHKAFMSQWTDRYAVTAVTCAMELLTCDPSEMRVAWAGKGIVFEIMATAQTFAKLYKGLIQPHLREIITEAVIPTLMLSPSDVESWVDDPTVFVGQMLEESSKSSSTRLRTETLVGELVKIRTKDAYPTILEICMGTMDAYAEEVTEKKTASHESILRKDAVLRIVSKLSAHMLKTNPRESEDMLRHHVLPELVNGDREDFPPVLKARACLVVRQFCRLKWSSKELLQEVLRAVCDNLAHGDLTVRVNASLALEQLVTNTSNEDYHHVVMELLADNIGMLLERLMAILEEVQQEVIVLVVNSLLATYSEKVVPHALSLIENFVALFRHVARDADNDTAMYTGFQIQEVLATITNCLDKHPDVLPAAEERLAPMINLVMEEKEMDFLDANIDIVTCLQFHSKQISEYVWSLYPLIVDASLTWAPDCLNMFVRPFVNYISKDFPNFLERSEQYDTVKGIFAIANTVYPDVDRDYDGIFVSQILTALAGYAKTVPDCVSAIIPEIVSLTANKFAIVKRAELMLMLCDTLAACFFTSPGLTLQTLIQTNLLDQTFNKWLSSMSHFDRTDRSTYSLVGLCTLIQTFPAADMPPTLRAALPSLMEKCFELVHKLQEQGEGGAEDEDEDEDEDDDGLFKDVPSDDDFAGSDDDDEIAGEMEGKLAPGDEDKDMFQIQSERLAAKVAKSSAMKSAMDLLDGDVSAGVKTRTGFHTPVDDVNHHALFLTTVNTFLQRDAMHDPSYAEFIHTMKTSEEMGQLLAYSSSMQEAIDKRDADAAAKENNAGR